MTQPTLTLFFQEGKLTGTAFKRSAAHEEVRTSTLRHPRNPQIKWCGNTKAFAVFTLEQAAWPLGGVDAAAEIAEAISKGWEVPRSAPVFSGGPRSAAATLAEAIKAKRSAALGAIFNDWLFVEDVFQKRMDPPAVWLDVRHFPQTGIRVSINGRPAGSAEDLLSLARRIEASHAKWVSRSVSLSV